MAHSNHRIELPRWLVIKNSPASVGDAGGMDLILWSRRSPGGGDGNPPQYYCLENCLENAWREVPGGLRYMQLQRVGHDSLSDMTKSTHTKSCNKYH